jgi:streptogramin lyase
MQISWRARAGEFFLGGSLLAGAVLLAGCSGGGGADASGGAEAHAAQVSGKVMGGRQPVAGATVTLYQPGTTGYGSGSALSPTATTGSDGSWSLTFTCPAPGTEIYAVVTGGNAGGGTNTDLALSAVLGPCGESASPLPTNADIDEVTTVASAFALAQFLDSTGQLPGAPASNAVGLSNAIGTLANLVNLSTGQAQTSLANSVSGTTPAATLNTLANLLATCVNSAGGSAGDSSACGQLFTQATPPGGTAPTTTLQAALDIALNPGNDATALYNLTSASGPYQTPAPLAAAPNDWTLAINFSAVTGAGAFDANGNFWFLTSTGVAEVNSNGVPASGSPFAAGTQPNNLAIDTSGHVWVSDTGGNSGNGEVSELSTSNGSLVNTYTSGGFKGPGSVAIDASGNVWVANNTNNSFTELTASASYAGTNYAPTLSGHLFLNLAFDGNGNLWGSSFNTNALYEFTLNGSTLAQATGSPYSGPADNLRAPEAIAIDASNHVWVATQNSSGTVNSGNGGLTEFVSSGSGAYTETAFGGGNVYQPTGLAIDGAGTLWVAEGPSPSGGTGTYQGVAVSKQGTGVAGSPYTGGGNFASTYAAAVRIDRSGNVWVLSGSNTTTVLVGAAAPVSTPLLPP